MTTLTTITHFAAEFVSNACAPGQVPTEACIDAAVEESGAAFKVASAVFRFIGIAVVIWTLVSVVKALIGMKTAEALKKMVGGILAAVLCFNLKLPIELIEGFGVLFNRVLEQVNDVISNNSK
jgi:hypothetical protein